MQETRPASVEIARDEPGHTPSTSIREDPMAQADRAEHHGLKRPVTACSGSERLAIYQAAQRGTV